MNLFFEICRYAFGNFIMGVLATAIVVIMLFILIKSIYKFASFTPLNIAIGIVLFIFLGYQFVTMSCAIGLKSLCNDFKTYVDNVRILTENSDDLIISKEEAEVFINRATDEYPLIGNFLDSGWIIGHNTLSVADTIVKELNERLNEYIWKRIGWSLLFIAIASYIIIKTMQCTKTHSCIQRPARASAYSHTRRPVGRGRSGQRISGF